MTYILQSVLIAKQNNYFRLFTNKNRCTLLYFKMLKSKFLNVAEKNDAAKNIAQYLSRGTASRREGFSKYNKIYEFEAEFMHQKCLMVMTSVSGHLLEYRFPPEFQWKTQCDPLTLFDAEVIKDCPDDKKNIKRTLENEVKTCNGLIIWTDCDREGENIGFEIIDVCKKIKPNLQIYRAKFSEITAVSVTRALHNLEQPNKNISDAVDVRQELDLRIGASFTRFQTMRLQKVFPSALDSKIVSYGSCQIPTLGFVVERYNAIENFIEEAFWKVKVNHTLNNLSVDFIWDRVRLFDQDACKMFHDMCLENRQAKVINVTTKPKSKFRPLPLDTIQLEKLASTKLKINAKETMRIAEKLYTSGFISYPRTETTEFPKEINLGQLISLQTGDPQWGSFAARVLEDGPSPRKGNKNDGAHPPIHPTKYADNLYDNEKRVYELIVRSFLACCSKNAEGQETTVTIEVASEKFTANGLMILARNYLEVYPYDKWSSKEIHVYQTGQIFEPTSIDMVEGKTSPPNLLTEADLIALMEKHGIGTDATHAEHIEKIKSRAYVSLEGAHFVPGVLGMGLVRGYVRVRADLPRPALRAGLEAALRDVCAGTRRPTDVLTEQIAIYKEIYIKLQAEAAELDSALAQTLNIAPAAYTPSANNTYRSSTPVTKCPTCGSDMYLRRKKSNENDFFIGCVSYPQCKKAFWLNSIIKNVEVMPDSCRVCGPNNKNLRFEWSNNSISHLYPPPYTGCIGGCDTTLNDMLGVNRTSGNPSTNPPMNPRTNPPMNPRTNPPMNPRTNPPMNPRTNPPMNPRTNPPMNPRTNPPMNSLINPPMNPQTNNPYNRTNSHANNERTNNQNVLRNNSTDSSGFVSDGSGTGNSMRNATTNVGDNVIICKCGQPTAQYTSRKQNENTGRKFYKCQANACNFFQWGPPLDSLQNPMETPSSSSGESVGRSYNRPSSSRGEEVECHCGWASVKKTVIKDGPNKGRLFYCCSKERQSCKFFQWADETTNLVSGGQLENNRGRGRGRGTSRGGGSARGTRKCGVCHQPGHFRNNCPNNNS